MSKKKTKPVEGVQIYSPTPEDLAALQERVGSALPNMGGRKIHFLTGYNSKNLPKLSSATVGNIYFLMDLNSDNPQESNGEIIYDCVEKVDAKGNETLQRVVMSTVAVVLNGKTYNKQRGKINLPDLPTIDGVDAKFNEFQSKLDKKSDKGHTHTYREINRGTGNKSGDVFPIDRALMDVNRSCKTAFLPGDAIVVEYTTDGGASWHPYELSAYTRMGLFATNRSTTLRLGGPNVEKQKIGNGVRVTIEPIDRYVQVDTFYCWFSTSGATCNLKIESSTIGSKNTFTTIKDNVPLSGWSGPNEVLFTPHTFGGGDTQYSNTYKYRFTILTTAISSSYTYPSTISDFRMYGDYTWSSANNMMFNDRLYQYDNNQNATFPGRVTANSLYNTAGFETVYDNDPRLTDARKPTDHNHDNRYYTIEQTNNKLATKMGAVNANGYYGLANPDGSTNTWIRTSTLGLIPYQAGGPAGGHGNLGTSSWYFKEAYIQDVFGTTFHGNALSASKLTPGNKINGTLFDGTEEITTEKWGKERTVTIGNTSKKVNGSRDVSWSLSEIGVSAAGHNHDERYYTKAEINKLKIGGRNLLRDGDIEKSNSQISYNKQTNTWTITTEADGYYSGLRIKNQHVVIPYGQQVIVSFEIKTPEPNNFGSDTNNGVLTGSSWHGNDNDAGRIYHFPTASNSNQWYRYYYSYSNTSSENTNKVDIYDYSSFGYNSPGKVFTYQIRNIKAELGSIPTAWTPAPEDKSDVGHNHDDRYYTESEINNRYGNVDNTADNSKKVRSAKYIRDLVDDRELSVQYSGNCQAPSYIAGWQANKIVCSSADQTRVLLKINNLTNDAQVKRSEMGKANGVATLDGGGKVPSTQLPSYVDDVVEYETKGDFPKPPKGNPETNKIYVAKDTNLTYRWGGSDYVEISQSLALGETSSTAYPGDKGKANAEKIDFITKNYLKLSGGTMTGDISFKTAHYTSTPLRVIDDTTSYGHTLMIGAGGTTYIGAGEAAESLRGAINVNSTENLYLAADGTMHLFTNCQDVSKRKEVRIDSNGDVYVHDNKVVLNNDSRLTDARTPKPHGMHPSEMIFNNSYQTQYRTQTKGDTSQGAYISAIRTNTANVPSAPQHGSGVAWGVLDTHGYLYTSYSGPDAYIGGGNANKLNWVRKISFDGHGHKANDVTFNDGQTFQHKYDTGQLKGESGVYVGSSQPTDPDVNVWINPNGEDTPVLYNVYTSKSAYADSSCKDYCTRNSSVSWGDGEIKESKGPEWDKPGTYILFVIPCTDHDKYISVQKIVSHNSLQPTGHYWNLGMGYTISGDTLNITTK